VLFDRNLDSRNNGPAGFHSHLQVKKRDTLTDLLNEKYPGNKGLVGKKRQSVQDVIGNKNPTGKIPNISRVLKMTNHSGMFPLPSSFNHLHHI
jgi:hypothetical protein